MDLSAVPLFMFAVPVFSLFSRSSEGLIRISLSEESNDNPGGNELAEPFEEAEDGLNLNGDVSPVRTLLFLILPGLLGCIKRTQGSEVSSTLGTVKPSSGVQSRDGRNSLPGTT